MADEKTTTPQIDLFMRLYTDLRSKALATDLRVGESTGFAPERGDLLNFQLFISNDQFSTWANQAKETYPGLGDRLAEDIITGEKLSSAPLPLFFNADSAATYSTYIGIANANPELFKETKIPNDQEFFIALQNANFVPPAPQKEGLDAFFNAINPFAVPTVSARETPLTIDIVPVEKSEAVKLAEREKAELLASVDVNYLASPSSAPHDKRFDILDLPLEERLDALKAQAENPPKAPELNFAVLSEYITDGGFKPTVEKLEDARRLEEDRIAADLEAMERSFHTAPAPVVPEVAAAFVAPVVPEIISEEREIEKAKILADLETLDRSFHIAPTPVVPEVAAVFVAPVVPDIISEDRKTEETKILADIETLDRSFHMAPTPVVPEVTAVFVAPVVPDIALEDASRVDLISLDAFDIPAYNTTIQQLEINELLQKTGKLGYQDIRELQLGLNAEGFNIGAADASMGSQTASGLMSYLSAHPDQLSMISNDNLVQLIKHGDLGNLQTLMESSPEFLHKLEADLVNLDENSSIADVRSAQIRLEALGLYERDDSKPFDYDLDGDFGSRTKTAMAGFHENMQKKYVLNSAEADFAILGGPNQPYSFQQQCVDQITNPACLNIDFANSVMGVNILNEKPAFMPDIPDNENGGLSVGLSNGTTGVPIAGIFKPLKIS